MTNLPFRDEARRSRESCNKRGTRVEVMTKTMTMTMMGCRSESRPADRPAVFLLQFAGSSHQMELCNFLFWQTLFFFFPSFLKFHSSSLKTKPWLSRTHTLKRQRSFKVFCICVGGTKQNFSLFNTSDGSGG